MEHHRQLLYDRLRTQIGDTPLTELHLGLEDSGSRVFIKQEQRNPSGSHYDRIILPMLEGLEEDQRLRRGDTIIDTTTGNSGAALAWLSRVLGFQSILLIPEDAPAARVAQIESFGASVEFSPSGKYTDGLISMFPDRLSRRPRDYDLPLNHAADRDGHARAAMESLGAEIRRQLSTNFGVDSASHVVLALGNGASLHVAHAFATARIVGFEPLESRRYYSEFYSDGRFETEYPGDHARVLSHGLWGTGAGQSPAFKWPLIESGWHYLEQIALVRRSVWEDWVTVLADEHGLHVGRSAAAAVSVAADLARDNPGATVVCIAYDAAWKYLSLSTSAHHDAERPPRRILQSGC